jgi:hypothetical protein
VAIASVAARVPDYLAGGVHPSRAVLRVAESWYTVGPALVLCLAGATSPDWGDWTIYLGALGARFAFDFVASVAHLGVGLRMRVRPVANELVAIYSVDALWRRSGSSRPSPQRPSHGRRCSCSPFSA